MFERLFRLANKQDVNNAVDELDMVETLEVEKVVNRMRCPTRVETCSCLIDPENNAINLGGIMEGYKSVLFIHVKFSKFSKIKKQNIFFSWLLDTILKNYTYLNSRVKLAEKLERRRRSSIASRLTAWSDSLTGSARRESTPKQVNKLFDPNIK